MATKTYNVGNTPPQVVWTLVRRDTASFKVYVTDDLRNPIIVEDWDIKMDIRRDGNLIVTLLPLRDPDDLPGEFTVNILSSESELLETGDVFDIQLTDPTRVWTVCQGSVHVIEDVTL